MAAMVATICNQNSTERQRARCISIAIITITITVTVAIVVTICSGSTLAIVLHQTSQSEISRYSTEMLLE